MGLVPKRKTFGALDLGTWMHEGLDVWYGQGYLRNGVLSEHVYNAGMRAMEDAQHGGAPEYVIDKASELLDLAVTMANAYERHYGDDHGVCVIGAEIPLKFTIEDTRHALKPDLVYMDDAGDVWLMEHKTATQVVTEHLTIDDQARPYGAMAERALRQKGLIPKDSRFRGIMYNFLRKAYPDDRLTNGKGQALNKNGTVSRRQPAPLFKRYAVEMTRKAKVLTLNRLRTETVLITALTNGLRDRTIDPDRLPKTPSKGCPRFCDYFAICQAEDAGTDIKQMTRDMFRRENPYAYTESTEDTSTFEMG
jgi:hypothetical protein